MTNTSVDLWFHNFSTRLKTSNMFLGYKIRKFIPAGSPKEKRSRTWLQLRGKNLVRSNKIYIFFQFFNRHLFKIRCRGNYIFIRRVTHIILFLEIYVVETHKLSSKNVPAFQVFYIKMEKRIYLHYHFNLFNVLM